MEKISSDILALISEAAVLVTAGKISFANFAAQELIGADCSGKKFAAVFGPDIAGCQSSSFIAELVLSSGPCTARVTKLGSQTLIFLTPSENPETIINEPFLYAMRNSLMSMELTANLIRSRAEALQDKESLYNISVLSRHYYRMTRLINNASFVCGGTGLPASAFSAVNISRLFADLLKSFSFFIPDIEIHSDLGSDIILNCAPGAIKRLLLNLMSNCAIHAKGCSRISVTLIDGLENLIISVSDDGCGIEASELSAVFERYRYGFDISEMGKGPGLGLTVVRKIARMHGGTLLLESRAGTGTSVRVSLAKKFSPVRSLHTAFPEQDSLKEDILTELSDCISPEFYSEKFMD